jgi:YjbE family integral membrane protein
VIALACRNLPPEQRRLGTLLGIAGAIVLRCALTFFAANLLEFAWLKTIGALLLLWIGIKLILPEEARVQDNVRSGTKLSSAIKAIILADFVMSLENVLGVAAAAHGNAALLIIGLILSISLVGMSSQLVLKIIDRFPVVIYAGGGLLGYISGKMLQDNASLNAVAHGTLPALCTILVIVLGAALARKKQGKEEP